MQWHYAKQGRQYGPVDDTELRRLALNGEIGPYDLVWTPDQGDEWAPASSVENLFTSPSPDTPLPVPSDAQAPTEPRDAGNTHNRDLMRRARESLRNRWGFGILVLILFLIINIGTGFIPYVGSIASLIITGPMTVGLSLVFLRIARKSPAEVSQLFHGFSIFGTALGAYLLTTLFVLLWSLLFIVPGIIATYSYAMTYFIIADDPTIGPLQAISRSKEMMAGRKWKLFCLYLRFFGWVLLCILTLGIGYIWLGPYIQAAVAHFYDDLL